MRKIILFLIFSFLFIFHHVNAGTEVPVTSISSSSWAYVMFNDGINPKIVSFQLNSIGSSTATLHNWTDWSVIQTISMWSHTTFSTAEVWKLWEFSYAGNPVVIIQIVLDGYYIIYTVYSQNTIINPSATNANYFNFYSWSLYFWQNTTSASQHSKIELATMQRTINPYDFNNFYPMWHIAYMQDNGAQMVYYYNNQYYLLNTWRELTGTVSDNDINTPIFNGNVIWWELQRITMGDQYNINKSKFRSFDAGAKRYYYLSACRTPTPFTVLDWTWTLTSYNFTFYADRTLPNGPPQWFFGLEEKYYDYVKNWLWIKQLNDDELIDRWGECTEAHAYWAFVGNTPTRIYYIRDNELYYYLLNSDDIKAVTGTWVAPWSWWPWSGNGVGEVIWEDPWEACSISTVTLESFFWCIWTWLSYLTKQILVFFNTIPQFINKFLEMWTTENRSISEIIFPKANADIVNDFMPPRSAGYSDTSIGQMDAMMTWIAYALIIIVALVTILILIKK